MTDADITAFIQEFEVCTLLYEEWTHAAHPAMGLHYLRRFGRVNAEWADSDLAPLALARR